MRPWVGRPTGRASHSAALDGGETGRCAVVPACAPVMARAAGEGVEYVRRVVCRARRARAGNGVLVSGGGVTSGRAADERDLGAHGASGLVTGPKNV